MTEEEKNIQKSPSLEKLEMEHKIEMDEKEQENTWRSCCYDCNKNAVMYFTTISIIVGIMVFCIYKLSTNESCENQTADIIKQKPICVILYFLEYPSNWNIS